jgi:hypothetical protein
VEASHLISSSGRKCEFASLRVLASLRETLSCLAHAIDRFKTRQVFRAKTRRLAKKKSSVIDDACDLITDRGYFASG